MIADRDQDEWAPSGHISLNPRALCPRALQQSSGFSLRAFASRLMHRAAAKRQIVLTSTCAVATVVEMPTSSTAAQKVARMGNAGPQGIAKMEGPVVGSLAVGLAQPLPHKGPSPIKLPVLASLFSNHPDRSAAKYLLAGFCEGF